MKKPSLISESYNDLLKSLKEFIKSKYIIDKDEWKLATTKPGAPKLGTHKLFTVGLRSKITGKPLKTSLNVTIYNESFDKLTPSKSFRLHFNIN